MTTLTTTAIPIRLTIKGDIAAGSTVQATLAIGHPMESGFRTLESGQRVPRNIIERITVDLGGERLFAMETSIGISAHPYMVFPVTLPQTLPGAGLKLTAAWLDDKGQRGDISRELVSQVR
jgi:sulfur-oxidizing protein SoxZ